MTDPWQLLAITGALLTGAGVVSVWLVRIEHRMTRLETLINERLPVRRVA